MASLSAKTIVSMLVGLLLVAYLFPIGIDAITTASFDASTSSAVTSLWAIIPILAIIGVLMYFVPNREK